MIARLATPATDEKPISLEAQSFAYQLGALINIHDGVPNGLLGAFLIHAAVATMTREAGRPITATEAADAIGFVLESARTAGLLK